MSVDFEEQLRADMGRVQVRPRPGLAREAHRRYIRSRHRTALAVAATGTAAAVAGATAGFALASGTGTSGAGPAETTAYVVDRVGAALTATNAIGYTSARYSGAGAVGIFSDRFEVWELGSRSRQLFESSSGQPIFDGSARPKDGRGVIIAVHYPSREWTSSTVPSSELPGPSAANGARCEDDFLSPFAAGRQTAADWKEIIQAGLGCGMFTVAGRQWVDGVDAIKLDGRNQAAGATIWVDPDSYLPVRVTGRVQLIAGGAGKQDTGTLTIDFRWLPPTRANLKQLTAPIPNGFRKVS
jgi:hypothetical protein